MTSPPRHTDKGEDKDDEESEAGWERGSRAEIRLGAAANIDPYDSASEEGAAKEEEEDDDNDDSGDGAKSKSHQRRRQNAAPPANAIKTPMAERKSAAPSASSGSTTRDSFSQSRRSSSLVCIDKMAVELLVAEVADLGCHVRMAGESFAELLDRLLPLQDKVRKY